MIDNEAPLDIVDTALGPMRKCELDALAQRKETIIDNPNEVTRIIEYFFGQNLIKRSAHTHLKKGLSVGLKLG